MNRSNVANFPVIRDILPNFDAHKRFLLLSLSYCISEPSSYNNGLQTPPLNIFRGYHLTSQPTINSGQTSIWKGAIKLFYLSVWAPRRNVTTGNQPSFMHAGSLPSHFVRSRRKSVHSRIRISPGGCSGHNIRGRWHGSTNVFLEARLNNHVHRSV